MDFRQLEYVITVAEEGSLLAASEKLFLSSSALSQHISRLEFELNTALFNRTKTGWILTPAGQIYSNMAREILKQKKLAYQQISDVSGYMTGSFTVGVTPGRGTIMFSNVFPQFKAMYPDVKVNLFEGTVWEISEMIATGKVDIGFPTSGLEHPAIETRKLAWERIVLVVPRSHPLSHLADSAPDGNLATVDLSLFRHDDFLLAGEGTTLRALENRAFNQAGFKPKIAFETTSLVTLNNLSKSGYGIAFVPLFYTEKVKEAVSFHTNPPLGWDLLASYRKGSYMTKAEEYIISLAAEYYNKHLQEILS